MKLVNLKCPECGAQLKVDPNREFVYCEYCGTKILLDKEEKITRTIDEAAIRKAEAEEKIEIQKTKSDQQTLKFLGILSLVLVILIFCMIIYMNHSF